MSQSLGSQDPIRPLSIGNIVTTGLQIYRLHLKLYFGLALRANLWFLLPIYGWAKYSTIYALISRLAFSELTAQLESVKVGYSYVSPRKWSLLIADLIVSAPTVGLTVLALYMKH